MIYSQLTDFIQYLNQMNRFIQLPQIEPPLGPIIQQPFIKMITTEKEHVSEMKMISKSAMISAEWMTPL